MTDAEGLPVGEVRAVLVSSAGALWFAVRGEGLAVMDGSRWEYFTVNNGLVSNGVADLVEVNGAIWAVGQGGYSVWKDAGWRSHSDVGGRSARLIFSVEPDADGAALWLGANGFAARWDESEWTFLDPDDGLPHAVVHQVLTDDQGATWFACRRGLARRREGHIEIFYPDVNFRSAVQDDVGRLWFGTGGRGVYLYFDGRWEQQLSGETVLPLIVDSRGDVWAVSEGKGVYRHDGEAWTRYTTADGLLSDVVYDIAEASDGSIWFGTDRGASRYLPPRGSAP